MIRRKLTLKRVDPWSVLKFGFVVNVALLLVGLLAFGIVWFTIRRLGLIEQFCGSVGTIVLDLQECAVNGGNIFRTVLFLGVLGVVVQTGIVVFGAFLYNLIADLTGGLTFSFLDESGDATLTSSKRAQAREDDAPRPISRPGAPSGAPPPQPTPAAGPAAAGAGTAAGGSSSRVSHDTGSARPSASSGSGAPDPRSAAPRAPGSSPAPGTSSQPAGAGDRRSGTPTGTPPSATSTERGPDRESERDEEGDEERDAPRPPRPSGSSLWGDPTRSRE